MKVILFNSSADPIVVDKTNYLSNQLELDKILMEETNYKQHIIFG